MTKRLDWEKVNRERKTGPKERKLGATTDRRRRFNDYQRERLKREAAERREAKRQP